MGNGLTLNVILHGTFAYIDKKGGASIDALIPVPEEGVDHVFRAGNWLGETELRRGTYTLRGVKTGTGSLDASRNLIFANGRARRRRDTHREYARFIFPRPKDICSLRLAQVDLKTRPSRLKGNVGAALQVFTYEVDNDQALCLQKISDDGKDDGKNEGPGHFWEPVFTGNYASLQIFSAEDHPADPLHTSRVFQKVSHLLGVKNIELVEVHRARAIEENELPPGVIAEETEDLAARTLRIARLGRLRRQKADLNQAWYQNEPLDGNPDACLCQVCL